MPAAPILNVRINGEKHSITTVYDYSHEVQKVIIKMLTMLESGTQLHTGGALEMLFRPMVGRRGSEVASDVDS